jgi:hypothetical protein
MLEEADPDAKRRGTTTEEGHDAPTHPVILRKSERSERRPNRAAMRRPTRSS